jgi:adenylate cyclase
VFDGRHIDVKGKAVFVGLSEVLLADRKDSFYTVYSRANGTFIGGVEIMATAFSNLLSDTPVKPARLSVYVFIILLWGLLVGVTCRVSNVGVAALAVTVMSILYLLAVVYQFKTITTGFLWSFLYLFRPLLLLVVLYGTILT